MAVQRRAGPGEARPSIPGGKAPSGGGSLIPGVRSRSDASFSICFGVGIRHDAGWSVMTSDRTQREQNASG
jgi:hypothetical protein